MRDKIVNYHPTKGYITFNDLLIDFKEILYDYQKLEQIIISILEYNNYDDETIASLFANDIANRLDSLISILDNNL